MSEQIGHIVELSDIEAVRTRYSMFLGSRGVTQLVNEIASNSIDEILANRCNRVDIFKKLEENGETAWYVHDYSINGIPLKTTSGEDGIISIATKLFSGGKYDNLLYKSGSAGANGVGVVVTCALSKEMTITTLAHNGKGDHIRYTFRNGEFVSKQLLHFSNPDPDKKIYSTEVKFIPDPKYFNSSNNQVDEEDIFRRLIIARSVLNNDAIITFNGTVVPNDYLERFKGENCVDMVSSSYQSKAGEYCNVDIALYDNFDSGKIFQGIVNTMESNEGTHKNVVQNLLKNMLLEIATKAKKTIQPTDIFIPIRINCVIQVKHIDFDEQVKSTFSNNKDELLPLIQPCIQNLIRNNKSFFDAVIEKAEEYRINLESSKQSRKGKVGKIIQVQGLRDCSCKDIERRSLYLVEGKSAAGAAIKARDANVDAILGLRGKVLNVLQATKSKIIANDVINGLTNALGYRLYGDIDPNKCRYSKIFIATDADVDGYHIACLLTFAFYTLFPELIKAGMIYVVLCPLYGAIINKQFIPIFDDETRQMYNNKGIVTRRFKGLGEMNASWLKASMFDPNQRRCIQLNYSDFDLNKLWKDEMGKLKYED